MLSLADRVLVMFEGKIVAEHDAGVTAATVGIEMLGGVGESAA